jgi:hypothetical protein
MVSAGFGMLVLGELRIKLLKHHEAQLFSLLGFFRGKLLIRLQAPRYRERKSLRY